MNDSQEILSLVHDDEPQTRMRSILLPATHALTGANNKQPANAKALEDVLRARLMEVQQMKLEFLELTEQDVDIMDIEILQNSTGDVALKILVQISIEEQRGTLYELGLTDQSALRMLAALVFRWKLSKETDLLNTSPKLSWPKALIRLQQTTVTLLRIAFPEKEGESGDTALTNAVGLTLIKQNVLDMLPATFSIGWLPPGECEEGPCIRALTLRLLSSFGLGESIQLLGVTLSTPHLPTTGKNAIKYLLSRRILQPKGLQAFLDVMTGQEEDGALTKYEQIAVLISTPPRGTSAKEYFGAVVPQLLDILLQEQSTTRTPQAAAYILSALISSKQMEPIVSPILNATLYEGFQLRSPPPAKSYTPLETVNILSKFAVTAPPTVEEPVIIKLLEPIMEKLYALLYHLETRVISDPTEIETCKGLLLSWFKLAPADLATTVIWNVIEGKGGEWFLEERSEELTLCWRGSTTSQSLKLSDINNLEKDAMSKNSLNLRPDPIHLVSLLKAIGRNEVVSLLFIRVLGTDFEAQSDDPTRELLRMQLLYQMQQQLPSSILSNPSHALAFVDHAISTAITQRDSSESPNSPMLIVKNDGGDDDDSQTGDILRTAVDFLLSCLEANPKYVPPKDDPHVLRVSEQLKCLALHSSMALRQASREASLVLTARLSSAAVSSPSENSNTQLKSSREKYQEALVLLQDPLLPVRAQGLAMLRHLVGPETSSIVDLALIPAILDIFVNSAQNEDSFIFLNAVKGLVAMVNRFGKDVFTRLLDIYATEPSVSGSMNRQELDMKLRIGEALGEVIGSCGQSLGGYVDILMPVMLTIIRDRLLPTTLRTSAISLTSRCVEVAPLVMSRYSAGLSSAMVDILELEHTVLVEPRNQREKFGGSELSEFRGDTEKEGAGAHNRRQGEVGDQVTDANPIGINPKLSPLRRSSIHLLGAIILQFLRSMRESHGGGIGLDGFPVKRAASVLRYLSVHDSDAVVNEMAMEVANLISEAGRVRLGLPS